MSHRIPRTLPAFLFLATSVLAADITGIWSGQQQGRRGEPEDVSFRFKLDGQSLTGKMFGDEFDLTITEGSVSGDQIRFILTTTNYYSKTKSVFIYTGAIKGAEIELVRERVPTVEDKAAKRPVFTQTLKLKRLT